MEKIEAYTDNYLDLVFECVNEGKQTNITVLYKNKSQTNVSDIIF